MVSKPQKNNNTNVYTLLVIFMVVALVIISGIALSKSIKYASLVSGMYEVNEACSDYCAGHDRTYFLNDFLVGACQCYTIEEEPAEFVNLYKAGLIE